MFFMVLMYDAAARDCEMLSLRYGDIDSEKCSVRLMGKGLKPRIVPINEDTVALPARCKSIPSLRR